MMIHVCSCIDVSISRVVVQMSLGWNIGNGRRECDDYKTAHQQTDTRYPILYISDDETSQGKKRPGQELSDKAKAKRAKYDPDQMRTVTKVQEFLIQDEQQSKASKSTE